MDIITEMGDSPARHRHSRLIECERPLGVEGIEIQDNDVYYPTDDRHRFFAQVTFMLVAYF